MSKSKPKAIPSIGREEPFPCWAWYGIGLFRDLPEADRKPFREWLLKMNKYRSESEQWPLRHLKIPTEFESPVLVEDIYLLKHHTPWVFEVASRKSAREGQGS
jgi:hypothetical protein